MRKIFLLILLIASFTIHSQDLPYKALAEASIRVAINDSATRRSDSFKLATSRAVHDDMANVYSTDRGSLIQIRARLANGSMIEGGRPIINAGKKVRLGMFGDSVGGDIPFSLFNILDRRLGYAGIMMQTPTSPTGNAYHHSNVSETNYWFNGVWSGINGSGNLVFQNSGAAVLANQLKIYYVTEPGAGSFQVQIDSAGTGYVNEGAVVDCNGTLGASVVTLNKGAANYNIRINQVSGNIVILFCAAFYETETSNGVSLFNFCMGGLGWGNANATPRAITNPVFADLKLDYATVMFKEDGNVYNNFNPWITSYLSVSPKTSWTLIASPPQDNQNNINLADNRALYRISIEKGLHFYDAYKALVNMAFVDTVGWGGDRLHLNKAYASMLGGQLAKIIGMDVIPDQTIPIFIGTDQNMYVRTGVRLRFNTTSLGNRGGMYVGSNGMRWESFNRFEMVDTSGNVQAYYRPLSGGFGGWQIADVAGTSGYSWDVTGNPGLYYNNTTGEHEIFSNKGNNTRGILRTATAKSSTAVVVNSGFANATNASVGIEINNANKVLLLSRGNSTAMNGLTGVNGMLYYNTDSAAVMYRDASGWRRILGSHQAQPSINFTGGLSLNGVNATNDLITPTPGSKIGTGGSDANNILYLRGNSTSTVNTDKAIVLTTSGPSPSDRAWLTGGGAWVTNQEAKPPKVFSISTTIEEGANGAGRYHFTGSAGTATVPDTPITNGWTFVVKNMGSGNVVITTTSVLTKFFESSDTNTITIGIGGSRTFTWDSILGKYSVD